MKRWIKICLVMIMILLVTGGRVCYLYAGEFGGFDIDIGAEEDIFDNREEEPEGKQDSAEPERKENESNNEGKYESGNDNGSNNDGNNSNNEGGSNDGSNENNNNNSDKNSANKSNAEAGQWNAQSSVGISDKHDQKSSQAGNSERNSQGNSAERYTGKSDSAADEFDFKRREEKDIVAGETEINANEKNTANEKKTDSQKKVDTETAKISDVPEVENAIKHSKVMAFGTVSTAIGMAKVSPEFKFYNSNDENKANNEKTEENNNKNVYFKHAESVPENECPKIQIIRMAESQDVTILSLRLNGEEIFFHQEGDNLIFDQPVTGKRNRINLLAVIDGSRIVQMPVWEF